MITHIDIGYNGRLGNQLFNYALLLAIKNRGYSVGIPEKNCTQEKQDGCYDSYHKKWISYRCYLNDIFKLNIPLLSDIEVNQINFEFSDRDKEYCEELFTLPQDAKLKGYFQLYRYFDDIRDYIQSNIIFKDEIVTKVNNQYERKENTVGIHIRLGDALGHPEVFIPDEKYITQALSFFDDKEYNYVVFSDNLDICKDWFPDSPSIRFVDNIDAGESLYLMSQCDNFIMSNSTFSWWGVYLMKNKNKRIVCPKTWIYDVVNNTKWTNNLIPTDWITI